VAGAVLRAAIEVDPSDYMMSTPRAMGWAVTITGANVVHRPE
jgi:hypothetical protein